MLSCKTGQNHSFIKTKRERQVHLTGAQTPHILFVLESGDTLKLSSRDIYSTLDGQAKRQIKSQGYLSDKSWQDLSEVLKNCDSDTLVFQNLSAVNSKSLSGILDIWVARELLLKGRAMVALKGVADNPKKLKYVFTKDVLGGKDGTFYTEGGKMVYSTIIAFGE